MSKIIIFFLCLTTTISCKKDDTVIIDKDSEQTTINLSVDGRDRSFLVYKPKGFNNAGSMPLIFINHGGQSTSQGILQVADFRATADRDKLILIYPQGFQNTWNDGRPTAANQLKVDDVNFFRQMCNYSVSNLSVDNSRIYATGLSNGGFMSARLGCELSDRIAAIAIVGASYEQGIYNSCTPTKTVSAIVMQGTADPLMPFNGGLVAGVAGGIAVSHNQAILKLVTINNCSLTPATINLPDIANDGTTVVETKYTNTTTNNEVIGYQIIGGGHTWAQGLQYLPENIIGKTCQDINGNEIIWQFFKRHKRN